VMQEPESLWFKGMEKRLYFGWIIGWMRLLWRLDLVDCLSCA
jgi:hypothetical protein